MSQTLEGNSLPVLFRGHLISSSGFVNRKTSESNRKNRGEQKGEIKALAGWCLLLLVTLFRGTKIVAMRSEVVESPEQWLISALIHYKILFWVVKATYLCLKHP